MKPQFKPQYNFKNHLILIFSLFAVNALRHRGIFTQPSFWAEDATFFFKESIELGLSSLWTPVIGHYHTLPRIVALIARLFPTFYAPLIYVIGAGLISSISFSLFYRPGLRWCVPSDAYRFWMAIVFSLVPGTMECFFALCPINYIVFCGIIFLLIEKKSNSDSFDMSYPKSLLICFLWFSSGPAVLCAPLLIYQLWKERRLPFLLPPLFLGLSVFLNILDVFQNQSDYPIRIDPFKRGFEIAGVFFDNYMSRIFYLPFFGEGSLMSLLRWPGPFYYALSIIILALTFTYLWRRVELSSSEKWTLLLLSTIVGSLYVVVSAVRVPAELLMRPNYDLRSRYCLVPTVVTLIIYFTLIFRSPISRGNLYKGSKFLLWISVIFTSKNVMVEGLSKREAPFTPFLENWQSQAAQIDNALKQRRVGLLQNDVVIENIPARPPDWGGIKTLRIPTKKW